MWRNSSTAYGWVSITLHWAIAVLVIALFGLGLWMVELGYYDPWYHRGPWWHKGFGALLLVAVGARMAWRWTSPAPLPVRGHAPWEVALARIVHALFYLLPLLLAISGYLVVTAAGQGLEVFDWFLVPATVSVSEGLAERAGDLHLWLAWLTIALAALHAAGALKHHCIDRDTTLQRMLRPRSSKHLPQGDLR